MAHHDRRASAGEAVFDRLTGHPVVSRLVASTLMAPLRVLAFHEIIDASGFREEMAHVADCYRPVSSAEVVHWLGGGRLPNRAVWITFDDGDPSVVESGLPILAEFGLTATMFVCPGVIGTMRPFWWQVAAVVAPDQVTELKAVIDEERSRRVLDMIEHHHTETGESIVHRQLSEAQIDDWVEAGHDVGNHTWDHPLLDQCSPEGQTHQIVAAHEWLADRVAPEHLLFAYPNGNRTDHARQLVADLGYSAALLFDHAVARSRDLEISRLRTNADDRLDRFRSIVAGAHPLVHRYRST